MAVQTAYLVVGGGNQRFTLFSINSGLPLFVVFRLVCKQRTVPAFVPTFVRGKKAAPAGVSVFSIE